MMNIDFKYLKTLPCELQDEYIIYNDRHMSKMKNVHMNIKSMSDFIHKNISQKDMIILLNKLCKNK